jgi:hypothetical protein
MKLRTTTFEIRIPACDRPEMLRRAIHSLQAQTYPYWKAIIFDDSHSSASRDIFLSIADDRITYVQNSPRLGAAGNIDQCFSPVRVLGGDYGCLLEDDNFWLPDFLSVVADNARDHAWELIQVNQRINEEGVGLRPANETTRGGWFFAGTVSPLALRATLFFMEGISTGGLVWRLGGKADLRVGDKVQFGLQEPCRSLLVRIPFLFIEEPHAVWTSMPKSKSARATETNRTFQRGMQSIREFVLRIEGPPVVREAKLLALRLGLTSRLAAAFAYSGRPHLIDELLAGRVGLACKAFGKGMAIRLVEKDPCAVFLDNITRDASRFVEFGGTSVPD